MQTCNYANVCGLGSNIMINSLRYKRISRGATFRKKPRWRRSGLLVIPTELPPEVALVSDDQSLKSAAGSLVQKKTKSCKGCLYYSSNLKSKSRNPVCVGISGSLTQGSYYNVGKSRTQAAKEGKGVADSKYGCAGFSTYTDRKNSGDRQETQTDLPVCVGIELLIDRIVTDAADSAPAHVHNKDGHAIPQPRTPKPAHSVGDDFFTRFTRNANLVANGVAKNARKVGNHLKESLVDLYQYRRPPK